MEYALLPCPFIFVKRMKNRFSSELHYAVLFCRDALDFGYFSVFVHVLGRGGKGIFLWKHFRDWILWHTYFKVQKSILQTSIYRQTLQQQSSPSPPISIERRVVSRWWFTVRKIFSFIWWIEVKRHESPNTFARMGGSLKGFASLRDSASTCCRQHIKSDFLHFWDPYVLLRSDFYSKGQPQCPL